MSIAKSLAIATLVALAPFAASAGSFTTLYKFTGQADGGNPYGPVIYNGGAIYGTTPAPVNSHGTVFRVDASTGAFTTVYAFQGGADGSDPAAGVIYLKGRLYGTTWFGGGSGCGGSGCGTVFSINIGTGTESILFRFPQSSYGQLPGALVYLAGMIYGTTRSGGENSRGSVFSISPVTGKFTTLYSFMEGRDGAAPNPQLLYQNDLFYGTTLYGGGGDCQHHRGCGSIFSIDPNTGAETILHRFKGAEGGKIPLSNLVYSAGSVVGDTGNGGGFSCRGGCGVSFAINTATGTETILDTFKHRRDSYSGLTIRGGSLYETLSSGGASRDGELLKVDLKSSKENVLYTFTGGADGSDPEAALVYHGGAFYGSTLSGGTGQCEDGPGCGTIFKFTP